MNAGERIATLEVKAIDAEKERAEIRSDLLDQRKDLKVIRTDVHDIKNSIAGHVGFLKGVVFVFTAFGALIGGLITAFWDKLHGQ